MVEWSFSLFDLPGYRCVPPYPVCCCMHLYVNVDLFKLTLMFLACVYCLLELVCFKYIAPLYHAVPVGEHFLW